ncbi:MAG: tRNA (adenosine(37)-N6)-dimethylallyltransferase MiaA [Flavobacteriaceae bacterium]|nr:tRNA (adenosine(37)-N6)-dimethylallyltransferase MiaA [Flavobacteriaceae bacterium]
MVKEKPTIYVVGGPTASGKTSASIALAQFLQTEIINADSRQVYKELQIGVAKPSPIELSTIRHHGISTVDIQTHYNAGSHAKLYQREITALLEKNGNAILCGGTGMYIEALIFALDEFPPIDPELRNKLEAQLKSQGIIAMTSLLIGKDSEAGKWIKLDNPSRVMRALELCIQTQKPLSKLLNHDKKPVFGDTAIRYIGISHPRNILYDRINRRVDSMIEQGLLEEAKTLYSMRNLSALQTLGYRELFDHINGINTLDQAILRIKQHTRNYAKRQITYFSNRFPTEWIPAEDLNDFIVKFANKHFI